MKRIVVIRNGLTLLLAAAGGGVFAFVALRVVSINDIPGHPVVSLLVLSWMVLALHEAGHLLGGRSVGFRMFLFACGPVMLTREGERLQLRFNRIPGYWGGIAGSMPVSTDNLRRRMSVCVAGGPAMSLLTGGVAVLLAVSTVAPAAKASFAMFGAISLGIAFATLIPGTSSGHPTDGARLIRMLRGGPDASRDVAIMALAAHSQSGLEAAAWDADLVESAVGRADGTLFEFTGRQFAVAHHAATGRHDLAGQHMKRILNHIDVLPAAMRSATLLEGAFMAAWYDRDAARARELLGEARPSPFVPEFVRPLVQAAIAFGEGDSGTAATLLESARTDLASTGDSMEAAAARERLDALQAALASDGGEQLAP